MLQKPERPPTLVIPKRIAFKCPRLKFKPSLLFVVVIPAIGHLSMIGLLSYFFYPFTSTNPFPSLESFQLFLALSLCSYLVYFKFNLIGDTLPDALKAYSTKTNDEIL